MNPFDPPNINPDYDPAVNPWMADPAPVERSIPTGTIERIDFIDAMRQNQRNTWLLITGMILLSGLFGYVLGWGWDTVLGRGIAAGIGYTVNGQVDWRLLFLTLSETGVKLALILAAGMSGWAMISLWRADKMVLSKTEAMPAEQSEFPQLHNVVEEMAIAAGLPKPRIVIVPTDVPNAFATGLKTDDAIIGVTRGLLARLNRRELQGVIAHEMGHVVNGDMRYMTIVSVMTASLILIAQMILNMRYFFANISFSRRDDERGRGGNALTGIVVLIVFLVAVVIVPLVARILQMAISRQREFLADATAVQLTRDPGALIGALEKIAQDQSPARELPVSLEPLYIMTPVQMLQKGHNMWLSTHPSLEKRIERLKALE